MGDVTTLSVSPATKERFEQYRHATHRNTDEVFETIFTVLPTYEELADGCAHCGRDPPDARLDRIGGAIHFFEHDAGEEPTVYSSWFCSRECLAEVQDDINAWFPDEPEAIVVGGYNEWRQRIESGVRYYVDDVLKELTIDVPQALDNYVGEPVYVWNRGRWIEAGVIKDVFHEEGRTALHFASDDYALTRYFHPDEELRAEYREGDSGTYDREDGSPRPVMEA